MAVPTLIEAVNHLREHFGLTMAETISVLRTPLPARDEFAMAALTGLCAGIKFGDSEVLNDASTRAYAFADAMLEARNANR